MAVGPPGRRLMPEVADRGREPRRGCASARRRRPCRGAVGPCRGRVQRRHLCPRGRQYRRLRRPVGQPRVQQRDLAARHCGWRHGHTPLGAGVEPAGDAAGDRCGRRHPEGGDRLPGHRVRLRWRTRLPRPADERRRPRHDDDDARHGRRRGHPGDASLRARLAGQVHRLRRAHEQEPRGAARQRRVGPGAQHDRRRHQRRGRAHTATTRRRPRAPSGPAAPSTRRWRRTARRGRASSDGKLLLPGRGRGEFVYRPLPHGYRLSGLAPDGQGPTVFSQDW